MGGEGSAFRPDDIRDASGASEAQAVTAVPEDRIPDPGGGTFQIVSFFENRKTIY
jgi:hypothetical protein